MAITSGFSEMDWPNTQAKYIVFTGSAAQSYTLADATKTPGISFVLKLQGTGVVTVGTTSSQTIDGAATFSLGTQYDFVSLFSDGHNWNVMASTPATVAA